jgi:hypothetical protein
MAAFSVAQRRPDVQPWRPARRRIHHPQLRAEECRYPRVHLDHSGDKAGRRAGVERFDLVAPNLDANLALDERRLRARHLIRGGQRRQLAASRRVDRDDRSAWGRVDDGIYGPVLVENGRVASAPAVDREDARVGGRDALPHAVRSRCAPPHLDRYERSDFERVGRCDIDLAGAGEQQWRRGPSRVQRRRVGPEHPESGRRQEKRLVRARASQ